MMYERKTDTGQSFEIKGNDSTLGVAKSRLSATKTLAGSYVTRLCRQEIRSETREGRECLKQKERVFF
jgi:hypothetical protein